MKLKHTKLMLASAVVAVAMPATFVLSQDRQQDPNQRDRQENRIDGMQRDQASPEQTKQMAEKWFKHQASSNQFEVELARLALERFGGQPQPGMQGDQQRQPGAGGGTGQQPGGMTDRNQPGRGDAAQPAGGQMDRQQEPGGVQHQLPSNHRDQLREVAQMIERDHTQALQTLRQHAEKEGVQISETPELEPVYRAKLDDMRQKQGEEFVRAFVFGNMASHTHGILELSWAQNNAPSQHIKEYARAILPRVQQHAQQIAPIAYEVAGINEPRTAGERLGDENRDRLDRDRDRLDRDRDRLDRDRDRLDRDHGMGDRPGSGAGDRPDSR